MVKFNPVIFVDKLHECLDTAFYESSLDDVAYVFVVNKKYFPYIRKNYIGEKFMFSELGDKHAIASVTNKEIKNIENEIEFCCLFDQKFNSISEKDFYDKPT